jgi:hypothetical protein
MEAIRVLGRAEMSVGFNLFFHLQVKGLERIDDALDLSVPKTCFFEPRTMLAEPL